MASRDKDDNSYMQNPNLKKVGVKHEFTKEQITEFVKCSKDPLHFINTHVKIVSVDDGLINFSMHDYQEKVVKTFMKNRYSICKFPNLSPTF